MMSYRTLAEGQVVADRFVIERLVGRGRSSSVYRALDLKSRSVVALKVLEPFLTEDAVAVQRFEREAMILRQINHPSVLKVYDLLQGGDGLLLCVEFFDGLDGKAYLAKYGPLALPAFSLVAPALVSAVVACHRARILHRDLKPQNLLINAAHEIRVIDFGLARLNSLPDLTRTGSALGTPEYMAPELFRSNRADARSEVYALGAVLHELLVGRPPFVVRSLAELLNEQSTREVASLRLARPEVPSWLDAVVRRCLRYDPATRYQSSQELLLELERGQQAIALREADARPESCSQCEGALLAGLPFCHHCGSLRQVGFAPGPCSVVFEGKEERDQVMRQLRESLGLPTRQSFGRQFLWRGSSVVVSGVSAALAANVVHQLRTLGAPAAVVTGLWRVLSLDALRIASAFLLVGLVAFTFASLEVPHRIAVVVAIEALIYLGYRMQARPLISVRELQAVTAAPPDPALADLAARLKEIGNAGLRETLARAVRSYVSLAQRRDAATAALPIRSLPRVLNKAIDAAEEVERYDAFLATTSLTALRENLLRIKARLREAREAKEIEVLAARQHAAEQEISRLGAVEDAHSRLYLTVLSLVATLQQMSDTPNRNGSVVSEAELAVLEAELDEGRWKESLNPGAAASEAA